MLETDAEIEGRHRAEERTREAERESNEKLQGKMHMQMYEREARRHYLKSRALDRERLQIMSRQSTRSSPSWLSRVAAQLGSGSQGFSAEEDLDASISNQYPSSETPLPDSESERDSHTQGERRELALASAGQRAASAEPLLASNSPSPHPKRRKDTNDPLEAIERLAWAHGRVSDGAHSLIKTGTMTAAGLTHEILPVFQTDAASRVRRRVVAGGAADQLHYSDGSMVVMLPPEVLSADPTKTAKPLPLRDGTPSGIAQRTQPKSRPVTVASGSYAHTHGDASMGDEGRGTSSPWEVSRLSEFHRRKEGSVSPAGLSFTTSLEDHEWEASVQKRCEVREAHEKALKRQDLEVLSEFYAIRKFTREQEGVAKVQESVQVHRQYERRKLEERHTPARRPSSPRQASG
mmetsp:Transcript_33611/g.82643  ORF Transcript_33611/g.82643 Transcript_33611/m.82643 type:complete len:406 (+) Transcript_33611:836-2053(+)